MTDHATPAGRRSSGRLRTRFGPIELVAVVVPLLTVAALALVRPIDDPATTHPPTDVPLARATLVCPTALPGTGTIALANADGTTGEVTTRLPVEGTVDLDATSRQGLKAALVAQAADELAAGFVGVRYGETAAVACSTPQPEQWFTGVGAGPEHSSVLELVNPDGGPAVADVTVLGPDGPLDVPALRGVTVPGGRTMRFDLADIVPNRDELALQVLVSRGRLGVECRRPGRRARPRAEQPRLVGVAGRARHDGAPPRTRGQAGRSHARAGQPGSERGPGGPRGGHQGERVRAGRRRGDQGRARVRPRRSTSPTSCRVGPRAVRSACVSTRPSR